MSNVVSITEAAKINNVTRQAIYVALKLNKLKASLNEKGTRWCITLKDLEDYRKSKYSRDKAMFNGELKFNPQKGEYSVNGVAELLNVPAQQIYYGIHSGKINAGRKGVAYVIHTEDIEKYRETYLKEREYA